MFLNYIHNFRGIAIIFIVIGHCLPVFNWENNLTTRNILYFIFQNGSVLFVFISGFLFQHLSGKYRAKKYFLNKLKNVILPYIIISVPAILFCMMCMKKVCLGEEFHALPPLTQIGYLYISGKHLGAFWFIPMIAIYYVLSPLLVYLDKRQWFYFTLPIFIAISILIPRLEGDPVLHNAIHFFSVYLFGMFASRYKDQILRLTKIYFPPLLVIYLTIFAFTILFIERESTHYNIANYSSKMFLCLILLCLLDTCDEFLKTRFSYLASISFGIYFVHLYGISFIIRFLNATFSSSKWMLSGNFLNVALLFTLTTLLCCAIIYTVRKVFRSHSRMIVGC